MKLSFKVVCREEKLVNSEANTNLAMCLSHIRLYLVKIFL